MIKIDIKKDFTTTPGGRWKRLGPYSGEEFFEDILEKKYLLAVKQDTKLYIDLDGVTGYPSSFRDQSFGELSRKYGKDNVLSRCVFKSDDSPVYIEDIKKSILGKK